MIKSVLVDARNWRAIKDDLIAEIQNSGLIGFDIETQDSDRHEGLNQFMKGNSKRLVFDVNRTVITGFSWYCDESATAYYLNLNHADVENRIPWEEARAILDCKKPDAHWVCHNAPYELTMIKATYGLLLPNVICTMQMAVSTFNEDQYPIDDMMSCGFKGISSLLMPLGRAFTNMDKRNLTEEQSDLVSKVLSKTSVAKHSYNGLVRELSYGYGLKGLTKKFFDYEQTDFKTVLNGKAHMGELTGEEVCAYGADDAYFAVRLLHQFLPMMAAQNDKLIPTFFSQENPMIYVFADLWTNGIKINQKQVEARRLDERKNYAASMRKLHRIVNEMLPFPEEQNMGLLHDSWYKKNPTGYRNKIRDWALTPLPDDPFQAVYTTSGPVSTGWSSDLGKPKSSGVNLSFYMAVRTMLYDLTGKYPLFKDGKVASDAEARGKLRKKHPDLEEIIDCINELADVEQRMKLYLNPYVQLIDPDTSRVYPVVSSKLNSRRMAMQHPNGMQLSKQGDSTYIRGFYEADEEDHVLVSIDWSQVELVEIGDFSGDPEFFEAYGQKPYQDLHIKAAAGALGISVEELKKDPNAKKLRGKIGKPANFGYWYSGALSTVADAAGWSEAEMWEATEAYRKTFAVAEQWRVDLINEARTNGYITLPDGHRRNRFEASYRWQALWRERWNATRNQGLMNFGDLFVQRITTRAGNQIVNSMIQGSCSTLAKRSILSINQLHNQFRFRFLMPIHDELVFSVHKDDVVEFVKEAKNRMCDHPEVIQNLVLDATASVGLTFEPFDSKKAPFGQIELDEAPEILGFHKDAKLNDEQTQQVVDYLFKEAA